FSEHKFESKKTEVKKSARIPSLYKGTFTLPKGELRDTFLDVNKWRKGIALVNGRNLGRYWPAVGPQETLYIPATFLKSFPNENNLVLFELEESPCVSGHKESCVANFVDKPSINATVPYK
ncbi:hypothetical protein B4U80_04923, partial [Leptotrombidium deliense]